MDKTLVSELEYMLDINMISHPEVYTLVLRAIKEIKSLQNNNLRLGKQLSSLQWKDAICTGSY